MTLSRLRALLGGRPAVASNQRRKSPLVEYDMALKTELQGLPQRTQAAFAAACAERLYPSYAAFLRASGRDDGAVVRRALDLAWESAKSGEVRDADPGGLIERCITLIADDGAGDTVAVHADDAIACAAYALQAAAGLDPLASGWAAQRVTDALDTFVLSKDIDPGTPDADQRVWEHPLMEAEIKRREDDLRRLADNSAWAASVDAVRIGAAAVSALPLDHLDHGR